MSNSTTDLKAKLRSIVSRYHCEACKLHDSILERNVAKSLNTLIAKEVQKAREGWLDDSTKSVDRLEVIDDSGRAYVKGNIYGSPVSVQLSLQDDGRTLKVFVQPTTPKEGEADE